MDKKLDRLVVVTDVSGKQYAGYIPESLPIDLGDGGTVNGKVDPYGYMYRDQVELNGVRTFVVNREVKMRADPATGNPQYAGLASFHILVPVEMAGGPLEKLYVRPVSWYFPKDNKNQAEGFLDLLRKAEENEKLTASAEVLAVPGVNA